MSPRTEFDLLCLSRYPGRPGAWPAAHPPGRRRGTRLDPSIHEQDHETHHPPPSQGPILCLRTWSVAPADTDLRTSLSPSCLIHHVRGRVQPALEWQYGRHNLKSKRCFRCPGAWPSVPHLDNVKEPGLIHRALTCTTSWYPRSEDKIILRLNSHHLNKSRLQYSWSSHLRLARVRGPLPYKQIKQ